MGLTEVISQGLIQDKFIIGEIVGKGGFSVVRVGFDKDSRQKVAIKYIPKASINDGMNLERECRILRKLGRSHHIIDFYGLYESQKHYMLVTEYMEGGELLDVLIRRLDKGKAKYTEAEVALIILQIARALHVCHSHGIVHRDVKPDNVFCSDMNSVGSVEAVLQHNPPVKLGDFGLAIELPAGGKLKESCGSPNYMAPERLTNCEYDEKSDIWSLGVLLYILIDGQFPFYGEDEDAITDSVLDPTMPLYDSPAFNGVSPECKALLRKMLRKRPENRPSAIEILQDPWLTGGVSSTKEIYNAVKNLKRFNIRRKFRAILRAIVAQNRMGQILRALRTERIVLDLAGYGTSKEDILNLANTFQEACWGEVLIDHETFVDCLEAELAIPDTTLADQLFRVFETDGKANTRDVVVAMLLRLGTSVEEKLGAIFWLFDRNGSGFIDKMEYCDMMIGMLSSAGDGSGMNHDTLMEDFALADTNGDGRLSMDEYVQLAAGNVDMKRYFKRLRRLMAGKREVFLSELDELKERKTGSVFIRYTSMFSSWNERYLAILNHKLFVFADVETAATGVPELAADLPHCTITSYVPETSSSRPGETHLRAISPPRLRVDTPDRQFLIEAKSADEIRVWLQMLVKAGAKTVEAPYPGGPASPRELVKRRSLIGQKRASVPSTERARSVSTTALIS